jgi:hypothetical protein
VEVPVQRLEVATQGDLDRQVAELGGAGVLLARLV